MKDLCNISHAVAVTFASVACFSSAVVDTSKQCWMEFRVGALCSFFHNKPTLRHQPSLCAWGHCHVETGRSLFLNCCPKVEGTLLSKSIIVVTWRLETTFELKDQKLSQVEDIEKYESTYFGWLWPSSQDRAVKRQQTNACGGVNTS